MAPLYVYACQNEKCEFCGKENELIVKHGTEVKCGNCGEVMKKLVTKAGIKMRNGASPSRYG